MKVYNYLINSASIIVNIKYSPIKYNQNLFKKQKKSDFLFYFFIFYIVVNHFVKMSTDLCDIFYQKFAKFYVLEYNYYDISKLP